MAEKLSKLAQLRALRERKAGKPAKSGPSKRSKAKPAARVAGKAKPRPRPNGAVLVKKAAKPKIGRPSTGFDRTAYQRVYCRNRLRYGPLALWPEEARAELKKAAKGQPSKEPT